MLYDKAKHRYDRACDEQRKHALHHSCIVAVYGQAAVDAALTEDAIAASNSTENKKRKTAFSALYEKAALHLSGTREQQQACCFHFLQHPTSHSSLLCA